MKARRLAARGERSEFFRPKKALLEPLQLHFLNTMLRPLARNRGARVLPPADAASVTGYAADVAGLHLTFLLISLDGRYATALTMFSMECASGAERGQVAWRAANVQPAGQNKRMASWLQSGHIPAVKTADQTDQRSDEAQCRSRARIRGA